MVVQVLAKGWVATDALQYLGTIAEADELRVGVGTRHTIEAQNLLLGIVGYHEELVVLAHHLDVVGSQPECPVAHLRLLAVCHLLGECHRLGIDMVVVDRLLHRADDALHHPWRITAVLLIGDKLTAVAGSAETGTVGQLAAILVVGTADGEHQLGDGTLEGTEVLAEDGLKLVQADESLAGARLHEVLVGVTGCGVVDEVLAEARRKEVGEEGGLEDATLAHENQDGLVHHLERHPSHHHRHEPFLEEVAKPFLGVEVVGVILHHDAVG